jgi:zinc-binding alcohol dehydrogenase family protein
MIQLARCLTGATVIATASRPETREWVLELGAHHVADHRQPLSKELQKIGVGQVSHVVSLNKTDSHFEEIVESLQPQGKFGLIDDPEPIDIRLLKTKSLSLHWELMFTRSLFQTEDMLDQHHLLEEVASLVDRGQIRTTFNQHFGTINAANLKRAHDLLESGASCGKIVLEGF